jgi:ABC-type nitrate/sulfonate/bicarbonate transport system substrate-binding protein
MAKHGGSAPGTQANAILEGYQTAAGLDASKSKIINVGAATAATAALNAGQVDVVLGTPFADVQIVGKGQGKIVMKEEDTPFGGQYSVGFVAKSSWLDKNKDVATRFCKAIAEADAWLNNSGESPLLSPPDLSPLF